MFTGIIEKAGRVIEVNRSSLLKLKIDPLRPLSEKIGDSISINGCCLTITSFQDDCWSFDVGPESLAVTNLGRIDVGDFVNYEHAMALGDRLGGHLVSGHVDGLATLVSSKFVGHTLDLQFLVEKSLGRYCVHKGSITIQGVSLTINELHDGPTGSTIRVSLIPATLETTNLGQLKMEDKVNIEVDLMMKFIERLTSAYSRDSANRLNS